jgi:polysaccharide biosynthesis protein PslH
MPLPRPDSPPPPPTTLRILFVTPVAFEHASGGGRTAAESFVEALRAPPLEAQVEVLALQARAARLPHRARQLVALLRSAVHTLPSKSLFYATAATIERFRAAVAARSCDLVVINGGDLYFLARYLQPAQARLGLALNVEGDLYEQQTKSLRAMPVLGRFFARDLAKLRTVETDGLRQLDGVVCLSSEDASRLGELRPGLPTLALPTSFSYPPSRREPDRSVHRPLKLGFLAKYGWWPNAEAAEWIIRRVLPGLPPGCVELHLYGPGSERFAARHPAIVAHGYMDDLAVVWAQSDIVVCPIVSGSGINIKVVEALYNGNPMLATSHAIRGLPPLADPAIVCLDTPAEWIQFLSGDRAEALARAVPGPGVPALFSTRSAVPRLAAFIARLPAR